MKRRARLVGLVFVAVLSTSVSHAVVPRVHVQRITGETPFPHGCQGNTNSFFGTGFTGAESEPTIAVNRRDPKNIITSWWQDASLTYRTAATLDGGKTWHISAVPGVSRCDGGDAIGGADEQLSFGPDGTAYIVGFSAYLDLYPPAPLPTRTVLHVHRSADGGRTWSQPSVVSAGALVFHDRPGITADPRRAGTVYVVWNDGTQVPVLPVQPIMFSRSDDHGMTWSTPTPAFIPPGGVAHEAKVHVRPNGDLLIICILVRAYPFTNQVTSLRSTNGGRTWSLPHVIAEFPASQAVALPGDCRVAGSPIEDQETGKCIEAPEFTLSSDSADDGTTFVAWRHPLSDRTSTIRFSRSSDGGGTWSPPASVTLGTKQAFLPSIAVSRSGKEVGILFDDLRRDVAGDKPLSTDVWFVGSRDGGRTWSEAHVGGSFDFRTAPLREIPEEGYAIGDYQGLASVPNGFVAAFPMTRPIAVGGPSDLYIAHIVTQ